MNTSDPDWPRVQACFERVADAAPGERAALLGTIAREQPHLLARVQRLLELDASGSDLRARVADWRDHLLDDAPPVRIGPWRIVRELGVGGMGRVYLAERDDGAWEQRVALKRVRGGMTTPTVIARFESERRILARLDHPGIAALIDGGIDANGRPWFAMQYVDGVSLQQHCIAGALGLEARLHLMIAACDAVAYAHRQLVVHCDLKPSNVLVDANGQPRLLDFGIARMLATDPATPAAIQTQAHAMTPGYAAPEQLACEPAGVATDVYALGAMLHELLSGRRPYADDGDTVAAIALAQARGEPPLLSRLGPLPGAVAARRLAGDLDLIVATALRHDPAQRYPGADALAADLRRHLDGRPIEARRRSFGYVARRFVARHRIAVPLAALALAALAASTAFALLQARDARHQAEHAQSVRNFLLSLFEDADPDRGGGTALSARALIDAGAARVRHDLGGDPDTRIELLGVVGNLYASLGDDAAAADTLAVRLQQAQQHYAAGDVRELRARLDLARAESERDHFERARELAEGTLAALAAPARESGLRADTFATLGRIEKRAGRFALAADWQRRRIALLQQGAADDIALATAYDDLGTVQHAQADYSGSARSYAQALQHIEAAGAAPPALLLGIRYDLALAEHENGHYEQADVLFRRNLELARSVYGDSHRNVADQLYQLGQNARQGGHEADSLPWLREALAIYERVNGPQHSRVATALTTLAQAQLRTGARAEAIANLERAYRIYLDTLGTKHLYTAVGETALAQAKLETGDASGAEAAFRDTLAKYADANPDHIYAEAARRGLGEALLAQRRYAEAAPLLRPAYTRVAAKFGPADQRSVQAAIPYAACLRALRRDADAAALLRSSRTAVETTPDTPVRKRLLDRLDAAERAAPPG